MERANYTVNARWTQQQTRWMWFYQVADSFKRMFEKKIFILMWKWICIRQVSLISFILNYYTILQRKLVFSKDLQIFLARQKSQISYACLSSQVSALLFSSAKAMSYLFTCMMCCFFVSKSLGLSYKKTWFFALHCIVLSVYDSTKRSTWFY